MKYLLWTFLLFIFLASCASSKKIANKEPMKKQPSAGYDETFDPLSLDDDDIVIEPSAKMTSKPAEQPSPDQPADIAQKSVVEHETDGWRVQIFVSNNFENATVKQEQAKIQFEARGHKVYLIFEAPYYKIRVGDLTERNLAEDLRDEAREMGYNQAFLVPGKVIVKKTSDQ